MGVEEAIKIALDYVEKLFTGSDHRLEEVRLRDDDSFDITISFRPPEPGDGPSPRVSPDPPGRRTLGIDETRQYKLVSVASDRRVRGVQIRPITVG